MPRPPAAKGGAGRGAGAATLGSSASIAGRSPAETAAAGPPACGGVIDTVIRSSMKHSNLAQNGNKESDRTQRHNARERTS